ncbi:putative HTH-type transcriptional regulator YttP [Maioricimonas rarisocia]|uniref:Putative HTH-type transcriptional regulator YttP n=1 Tax=Maioricimonas rarisocia TaxID=2528026 RepID=A0A517ZDV3_9PLAN|nr:CerR family C-terminal domain-containing protein [Maioricimonas rarisocia]QDU40629.1 putative HTH-type transcriptional regulator YttP [Maioricimonas rarisocia]
MADDTRDRVIDAAGPIFAEKGFEGATVREICQAAGVNLASVNYHFGDKQRLYFATVKAAHLMRMKQVPPAQWPEETTPEEQLRLYIHTALRRMLGHNELSWQMRLMTREILQPTGALVDVVEQGIRPQLSVLLGILDHFLPPDTPEHVRYQTAFSIIGQCLHYRFGKDFVAMLVPEEERNEHYSIEQLADQITRFSLAALTRLRDESQQSGDAHSISSASPASTA